MKILQVVQKPQPRGAEVFVTQLNAKLEELGHETATIYLYDYFGESALALRSSDACLGGRENHPSERWMTFHPGLLRALMKEINLRQPDIVSVNGARTVKYGALCRLLAPAGSWKLVYRNIDNPLYWVRDSARQLFYRHVVMPRIDGVIGVSEATLSGVRSLYDIRVPAVAIPNGVDSSRVIPYAGEQPPTGMRSSATAALLLFFGSLTMQKRPDRFLRIVKRVSEALPNLEAWVLGDGPLLSGLRDSVESLELKGVVRFCGYQERIAPYLASADLLVVTSDSEGIPAVILEAAFAGVPTVASDVGGIRECIAHGRTGILLPAEDEERFAKAILELLKDAQTRRALGDQARIEAREHFDIGRIARWYLDFYQRMVTGGNPERGNPC